VLAQDLARFLELYDLTTTGLDAEDAAANVDTPEDARSGSESRRYRWHLRAEGRNRAVVKRAKELQGYTCRVCGRDFVAELGDLGKRCIDAHHLTPFAQLDERPRELDPRADFAIVCANCHRLLHSETLPLVPEELATRLTTAETAADGS
jgi:5-methylcytosine-specific restriction enzyme A